MSGEIKDFHCPKCGGTTYEVGEIRVAGGFVSKIFDVQNKRLTTVTFDILLSLKEEDSYRAQAWH